MNTQNKNRNYNKKGTTATQRTKTHIVSGILVGAGIDQQPHAVYATLLSGAHQRRRSDLQASRRKLTLSHK
jgi:hypothetical protein